uniref:Uncharacterized protein n=1 Tax=Anopheles merus TaxID=30066 RepID=A0A182US55_ANOME
MRNGGIYIEASIDHTVIGQDQDPGLAEVVFDNVQQQRQRQQTPNRPEAAGSNWSRREYLECERCSDGSSFGFVSASRADIDWAAPPCGLWPWACAATSDWPPPSPPMPPPTLPVSAFFFCLRSLARRFWNQIFTCRSDSCRFWASSAFRRIVM